MRARLELHAILKAIPGVREVYFQPPESIKLNYPCIIYNLDRSEAHHADNKKYIHKNRYTITVIDKNPDSVIPGSVTDLDYCAFDRFFTSDNLNHYVFTLYF